MSKIPIYEQIFLTVHKRTKLYVDEFWDLEVQNYSVLHEVKAVGRSRGSAFVDMLVAYFHTTVLS